MEITNLFQNGSLTVGLKIVWLSSKRFGYGSRATIKLIVWFKNHYNGSINFGLTVRFMVLFDQPNEKYN